MRRSKRRPQQKSPAALFGDDAESVAVIFVRQLAKLIEQSRLPSRPLWSSDQTMKDDNEVNL